MHLIRKLISSHSKLNAKPSLQRDLATFRILHVIDNYPPNMHSILFVSHPRLFITHPHIYKCTCHWSNLLVHIIDKTLCSNSVFWISFFYKKKASFHISLSIWFKNQKSSLPQEGQLGHPWDTKNQHFLKRVSCDPPWDTKYHHFLGPPLRISDPRWARQAGRIRTPQNVWTGPTIPPASPCRP